MGAMNFDKPLRLDAPEIRANIVLKCLLGVQNGNPLMPAPENCPVPERVTMFHVPFGGKESERRQRPPGLKGRLRWGRLKAEVQK